MTRLWWVITMPVWLSLVIINRLFRKKKLDTPVTEQPISKLKAPWRIEIHDVNGKIYAIQDADIKNINSHFTGVADFHIKDTLCVSTSMLTYNGKFMAINKIDNVNVIEGQILRITHTIKSDAAWGNKLLRDLKKDHLRNILQGVKNGKWKDGRTANFSPDMRKAIFVEAARRGL